jgi:predicted NAD/FAD-dependent oxidoreductase
MAHQVDVLIVGAGLAGLLAARRLVERGIRPMLLEKGRAVGGRIATYHLQEGLADSGAQFFTTRDPVFEIMVNRWLEVGLAFEWSRGWSDGSLASTRDGHPRYAIRGGMSALAKYLAQGLDVRLNVPLEVVRHAFNGWEVEDENGTRQRGRAIILTAPVPQSLALLDEGGCPVPQEQQELLSAIDYDPCLTGLFRISGEITLPPPGAIQRPHAPIYWIADNQRKGISPDVKTVTMQASPAYSRQLYDEPDENVLKAFRTDLLPFMGDDAIVVESQLKRWRYSQPMSIYPDRCLATEGHAPLVFAGDAFGGPRIEGAILSGIAAGDAMATLLERWLART